MNRNDFHAQTNRLVPHPGDGFAAVRSSALDPLEVPRNAAVLVALDDILEGDSPRLEGEDAAHVLALAEIHGELPPIIVHRESGRVIDGMHRLKAAKLAGVETIPVVYFDGDEAQAFVLAVRANVAHGLPLSLAERKAAAQRILGSCPQWSDRAIGQVTGLSAKTIASVRRDDASGVLSRIRERVGRDGRVRPLNTVDGRRFASELISLHPEYSSREIARRANISPSTVRDVRDRLQRGIDPVPTRARSASPGQAFTSERRLEERIHAAQGKDAPCREDILKKLSHDPALYQSHNGRRTVVWLHLQARQVERDWGSITNKVPRHCRDQVADLACSIAEGWLALATAMRVTNR